MSRDADFVRALDESFSDRLYPNCLTSTNNREVLIVEDDLHCSRFADADLSDEWKYESQNVIHKDGSDIIGFFVHNPTRRKVWLLSVDQCFFKDSEQSRCDCLIFNDVYICFIELKLEAGFKQRKERMTEARNQLKSTIAFFKSETERLSPRLFGLKPEAYAVLPPSIAYPVYPRSQARRQSIFTRFLEDTGVKLVESNAKMVSA